MVLKLKQKADHESKGGTHIIITLICASTFYIIIPILRLPPSVDFWSHLQRPDAHVEPQ